MSARATYWVWRRELQVTLRAPIVYAIGGLFLAVQGIAFGGLVSALSDPRRPAPLGALLEGQLAGTLLTWVLQLVVLTLLGMRTIADDKRSGAWELLLTAQVSERAAVIGKWLAAVTIYALLWLPTLAYLIVVAMFRVDDGGWDIASIVTGYLGAIAVGAALLAWTVAASAASTTTLVAGAVGFALLIGLFLVGELPASFPDLAIDHPTLARALGAVSLRGQLTTFARGELAGSSIVFVVGLALVGLSLAIAFACVGRRRRSELRNRFAATVLFVVIAIGAGRLARPLTWDVSGRNTLDPETVALLHELPSRATLTIVQPTLAALEPIYDEVERVAARMADAGPVTVRTADPATLPGGLEAAARVAGVSPADLASHGGVVVEVAGKRSVVDRVQMVSIARDAQGTASVESIAIEQAITGALAQLLQTVPVTACATTGHGELPLDKAQGDADWRMVADRLRGDGIAIETVGLDGGVPAQCNVLIVAGPTIALSADEALAIQAFVTRGGGLLVAAAARPVTSGQTASMATGAGTTLAATGLEGVLAAEGLGLPAAIAVDPSLTLRELQGALLVFDGYAKHEINAGFAQTRGTIWFQPRVVVTTGAAQPLVQATSESWGERDLVSQPEKNLDDIAGPVAIAAIGGNAGRRVIAVGSAESFMTTLLAGSASAADLWLAHAVRFLAGKPAPKVSIAARAPQQVRLLMTSGQRRAVMVLSILGIPLAWIVIGAALLIARRRRT
jgi:ABC-type transport system involved in multi-copper enzyme maturation permease subunit